MNFKRMTDLDLAGKRVLIREDLNVPVKDGKVTSDSVSARHCQPFSTRLKPVPKSL